MTKQVKVNLVTLGWKSNKSKPGTHLEDGPEAARCLLGV